MAEYHIQYDDQHRPFLWENGQVGGKKNYISPVAFGGETPADTTSILHQGPQWNQHSGKWETPIDWGNILNIGVASGLGAGALDAFLGAGGAAAGAGSSVLPSSDFTALTPLSGVGSIPPAAATVGGVGVSGAIGDLGLGGAGADATAGAGAPVGAPGVNTTGPDLVNGNGLPPAVSSFFADPANYAKFTGLIPLLMQAFGGSGGGAGAGSGGPGAFDTFNPDLKSLLDMSVSRAQRTDPLHAAVTQLAMSRLPTSVQR